MNKKIRTIVSIMLISATMLSLTACNKKKFADKDGNMLEYEEKEAVSNKGYYVHVSTDNDTYYNPLLQPTDCGYQSFEGGANEIDNLSTRFIMMCDYDHLIPTITGDNLLVYVNRESLLPSTIKFERFEDRGYTFGAIFETSDTESGLFLKSMSRFQNTYWIDNSSFEDEWENKDKLNLYAIDSISDTAVGERNIDSNGIFMNLEKDANYEMIVFQGTGYETVVVKADTHYLVSAETTTVKQKDSFIRTKNGYAVVKIPSNLESGYYMIDNTYLFYYDKENAKSPTTDDYILDTIETIAEDETEDTSSYYDGMTFENGDDVEDYDEDGDVIYTETEAITSETSAEDTTPTEEPTEQPEEITP